MDEEGALAATRDLPFVIAVGRNQAAAPPHRVLEGRLVVDRLGSGIDQERHLAGILDPGWDKPPTHQLETPRAIFDNHHRYRLRRRNIMPWREIRLLGIAEHLPDRRWR